MAEFRVKYVIDVEADTPEEAARIAQECMVHPLEYTQSFNVGNKVIELPVLEPDDLYVIYSKDETDTWWEDDGVPMFWNNDDGWTPLEGASVYTADEKAENEHNLPIGGEWMKLPRFK